LIVVAVVDVDVVVDDVDDVVVDVDVDCC